MLNVGKRKQADRDLSNSSLKSLWSSRTCLLDKSWKCHSSIHWSHTLRTSNAEVQLDYLYAKTFGPRQSSSSYQWSCCASHLPVLMGPHGTPEKSYAPWFWCHGWPLGHGRSNVAQHLPPRWVRKFHHSPGDRLTSVPGRLQRKIPSTDPIPVAPPRTDREQALGHPLPCKF